MRNYYTICLFFTDLLIEWRKRSNFTELWIVMELQTILQSNDRTLD